MMVYKDLCPVCNHTEFEEVLVNYANGQQIGVSIVLSICKNCGIVRCMTDMTDRRDK